MVNYCLIMNFSLVFFLFNLNIPNFLVKKYKIKFNLGEMFGDSICNDLPYELDFLLYTLIELN